MIKQVSREKWLQHYHHIDLCDTGIPAIDFAEIYGVVFEQVQEDGRGLCHYACVEIERNLFLVVGMPEASSNGPGAVFRVPGNAPNIRKCLEVVSRALGLRQVDMKWIQQDFDLPHWSLVRQGDDANEVEITRFHKRDVAVRNMKRLESLGHKQYYNVRKV